LRDSAAKMTQSLTVADSRDRAHRDNHKVTKSLTITRKMLQSGFQRDVRQSKDSIHRSNDSIIIDND